MIMDIFPKLANSTLCLTCLSVGRKMIKLKELCDVYHKVVAFDTNYLNHQMDTESLCWECHATLQRIHKFQKQAHRAQELLNSNQDAISTLSTLTTYEKPSISLHNLHIKDEVVLKDEKIEVEESQVTCEFIYDNDDHFDDYDEMKTEVEYGINEHDINTANTEFERENCTEDINFSNTTQISDDVDVTFRKVTAEDPKCADIKMFKDWKPKNRKCKSTTKLKQKSNKFNQINIQPNLKGKSKFIEDSDDFDPEIKSFIQPSGYDIGSLETGAFHKANTNDTDIRKTKQRKNYRKRCETMNELPKYRYLNDIEVFFIDDNNTENKNDRDIEKDTKESYLVTIDRLVFRCRICGMLVNSAQRETHIKQHKKAIQCIICEIVLDGRREYFKHYKECHKKFICDVCGVQFKVKFLLERHIRSQHMPITCEVCNKKYRSQRTYRGHLTHQHSPTVAAYCVECDECFDSDYHYRQHLSDSVRHRRKPAVKIPCPDCDKVFSKNIYMLNHRDFVHLKNFKNRCELCDKNYLRKSALVNHNRLVHEGVQPNKNKICYICGRGFAHNKILSHHLYTHTGERPHACDVCPARFSQLCALTSHRRARHPAAPPRPAHRVSSRPYGCDRCPAKYGSEQNLDEHKKTIHLVSKVK